MGLDKRTIKIIVIVVVTLVVIGSITGLLLGLLLPRNYVRDLSPSVEHKTGSNMFIKSRLTSRITSGAPDMSSPAADRTRWLMMKDLDTVRNMSGAHAHGITSNPRELEVWPQSDEYNYYEPLIHFRAGDPGSWHPWYKKINDFLRQYETTVPEDPPRAPCSVHRQDQRLPVPNCEHVLSMWMPCNADNFYGYVLGRPCVFLRLANIHYWVPEPYNVSVPLPIPNEMPSHIQQAMRQRPAQQFGDYIWVSCDGEFNSDKENIGPIQYIPHGFPPGFPMSRLHTADRIPYSARSLPDQSPGPLVGVFFENPHRGVVINVECRIWTRDIYYDSSSRVGRARFELFIE